MVHPAIEFYICLSLFVTFCTVICFAECGKCPREGVPKPLYYDVFGSVKGTYNGLPNSYSSYFISDYAAEHQKTVPLNDNACLRSDTVRFHSTSYGFQSEAQCLRARNLDINRSGLRCALHEKSIRSDVNVSWSLDDVVFHLLDGEAITCSSNFKEFGHAELPPTAPSVNGLNQIVVSSCRGHLFSKKETFFSLHTIEIQKSPFSDPSSPRLNISPSKLNWGRTHIYHMSVASLRLKNTCNEFVLTVYDIFSTNSQFYPFNFDEVVLGPGEVTTLTVAYLPNRVGFSSAELVLLTSFGGFLVEAEGFAIESPYKLRPLVGFDVSSGGWLSRKLLLSNPFDEMIDLEEVTALILVYEGTGSVLVESVCRKQKLGDYNKHSFSNGDNKRLKPMVFAVRPLSKWLLSPRKTHSIMEMAFLPDSKGKFAGAICMQVLRSMEGEKDILVIPFEAELSKIKSRKDAASPLSVSIEAVGPCGANETTISISVRNHASHLLKIVNINEMVDSKKLFQIKYLEGLFLFPGSITQVALVTFESSKFEYDSFLEMPDLSITCKVEIRVNDSLIPHLEVPCLEIFGVCPSRQQTSLSHMIGIDDRSNSMRSMSSVEKSPILTQALAGVESDVIVLDGWKDQSTVNGSYLLDNNEILFPRVLVGEYYAKSITVSNPSDQPVIVQLILNRGETIDDCKSCSHQQSPSPSSSICNDSIRVSGSVFSISDTTVTEAFLHPHGTGSLGPILFHPSNRCEWKSTAFLRSNLSGLELLSLRGFGGALSLVMLEGSEFMQRLDFNINLPALQYTSNVKEVSSCCRKPLLKKLFAVNAGDFPIIVKRIDVSGRECGLDGFVVHNCRGFSLEPGESMELGLSYQSDFSMPLVQRELELILAVGILVIPMQASLPLDVLSICAQSILWLEIKRYSWVVVLTVVLVSLLVWCTILYQGTKKTIKSMKTENVKPRIITGHTDRSVDYGTEINPSSECVKGTALSSSFPFKSMGIEHSGKQEVAAQPVNLTVKTRREKRRRSRKRNALIEVSSSQSGNSTPTSPLSPVTTLSPPETCSPSLDKMQPRDSFSPEPVASARRVPENQNQESFGGPRKPVNQATFTPSATFPGVTRNTPSRLAIGPRARAPGPMIHSQNAVEPEENTKAEDDRFTYNIWGNHLSGVHLCRPNSSITIASGTVDHSSNSFFFQGPR